MSGLRNRPCICWSARCTDWRSWNSSVDPGDFTRTCMDAGAASLIGVDSSAEMLRHAPALRHVRYVHAAMETLERPPASVDLVYSSMALHFMEGVSDVFSRTAAWIRPGGHLVVTIEHPLVAATSRGDWIDDGRGALAWSVDQSLEEGPRRDQRGDLVIVRWHRSVSSRITMAVAAGFQLERLVEPCGVQDGWQQALAVMAKNHGRPAILGMRLTPD